MSEEIIKVLNYIGDQLGIAIDWSSENIWPYVVDVLGRYSTMEIINHVIGLVILLVVAIAIIVVLCKSMHGAFNAKNELWYDDYLNGPSILSIITWVACFLILCAIVIPLTIVNGNDLLKWAVVPEIKYLDMLKSYFK